MEKLNDEQMIKAVDQLLMELQTARNKIKVGQNLAYKKQLNATARILDNYRFHKRQGNTLFWEPLRR